MTRKLFTSGSKIASTLATIGLVASGIFLISSPASAGEPVAMNSRGLPVAGEELNASQFAAIAELQTPEEIEAIVAMAGPDQWVQTYTDSATFEKIGAVLLETPPAAGLTMP